MLLVGLLGAMVVQVDKNVVHFARGLLSTLSLTRRATHLLTTYFSLIVLTIWLRLRLSLHITGATQTC